MKAPIKKAPAKRTATKAGPTEAAPDPGRFVSQERLAKILDRNRTTIREWTDDPKMPCVKRADKEAVQAWLFDIAEVVKWREGVVAEKGRKEGMAAPRMPSAGGDDLAFVGDLEPKDRIRLAKQIIDLSMAQRYACSPAAVEVMWTRAFRDVGNACMSIPELCARDMGGLPEDVVSRFRRTAKDQVAAILKQAAADFAKSLSEVTTPPTEPPKQDDDEDDEES